MITSNIQLSLANIRGGAVVEAFDAELEGVLENMQDPNTNPTAVREITLKLKIKPDEDRAMGDMEFTVWPSKLAPRRVVTSKMIMGINPNGLTEAHEFTAKQMPLFSNETESDGFFENGKVTAISGGRKEV
jgi:hypothetical protein